MKKINCIILAALMAFDFLMYKQQPGINVIIFNCFLISFSFIAKPELKFSKHFLLSICAVVISSACVAYYGDELSCSTAILSMALMATSFANKDDFPLTAIFSSGWTYLKSPISIIKMSLGKEPIVENKTKSTFRIKLVLTLISVAIAIFFLLIYQNSNLLFSSFTRKIDLSFINWSLFFFTLNGFFLIFTFFNYSQIKWLNKILDKSSKNISINEIEKKTLISGTLAPEMEKFMGLILLSLLNGLLLIVNILDLKYLINGKLPEGITYSQYVHQGVGMLVLSIFLAILLLMYLFRGSINFIKDNLLLKVLAYTWALQNIFMIVSTIFRNNMYIDAYGLTEKRIGVYFYLILSVIGLLTSIIKIYKKHSNSYLIRINTSIFFVILVLSCTFNWDNLISNHNLAREDADRNISYLNELNSSNIPLIFNYLTKKNNKDSVSSERLCLNKRIYLSLTNKKRFPSWKSWNYCDFKTINKIKELNIKRFDLQFISLKNVSTLANLNLEELHIINCYDWNVNEWSYLTGIKRLYLNDNYLHNISFVGKLKNLEYLEITNKLQTINIDYSPLYSLKNLKVIIIDKTNDKAIEYLRIMLPDIKIYSI